MFNCVVFSQESWISDGAQQYHQAVLQESTFKVSICWFLVHSIMLIAQRTLQSGQPSFKVSKLIQFIVRMSHSKINDGRFNINKLPITTLKGIISDSHIVAVGVSRCWNTTIFEVNIDDGEFLATEQWIQPTPPTVSPSLSVAVTVYHTILAAI